MGHYAHSRADSTSPPVFAQGDLIYTTDLEYATCHVPKMTSRGNTASPGRQEHQKRPYDEVRVAIHEGRVGWTMVTSRGAVVASILEDCITGNHNERALEKGTDSIEEICCVVQCIVP